METATRKGNKMTSSTVFVQYKMTFRETSIIVTALEGLIEADKEIVKTASVNDMRGIRERLLLSQDVLRKVRDER